MTFADSFKDFFKTPLLAISVFVLVMIGMVFDMAIVIPPFAASLFMIIYIREGSYDSPKHVFFSHIISFGMILIVPFITPLLSSIPSFFIDPVLIGFIVLLSGWIMVITDTLHPPAVSVVIILLLGTHEKLFSLSSFVSFTLCLLLVTFVSYIKWKRLNKH